MDALHFEVLDGAKAHVGKILEVEVIALTDTSDGSGATSLRGRTFVNAKRYEAVILEYPSGLTVACLERGIGTSQHGRIMFSSLKLV